MRNEFSLFDDCLDEEFASSEEDLQPPWYCPYSGMCDNYEYGLEMCESSCFPY